MKIFPLTIYVLLKPFIQILDSKKSLWDSRTTATLGFLKKFRGGAQDLGQGGGSNFFWGG
jgi:hypothetical protein